MFNLRYCKQFLIFPVRGWNFKQTGKHPKYTLNEQQYRMIFDKMSLKMCLSDDYKIEVTDNTEIFQIIYYLENKLIAIFTCKVHIQSNKP